MEIIIPLPQLNHSVNTYKELKGYLKQVELAVHHAQKSVENAEKDGIEITEDCYINFNHPFLKSSIELDLQEEQSNETLKNFMDNYFEELQRVEIAINLI